MCIARHSQFEAVGLNMGAPQVALVGVLRWNSQTALAPIPAPAAPHPHYTYTRAHFHTRLQRLPPRCPSRARRHPAVPQRYRPLATGEQRRPTGTARSHPGTGLGCFPARLFLPHAFCTPPHALHTRTPRAIPPPALPRAHTPGRPQRRIHTTHWPPVTAEERHFQLYLLHTPANAAYFRAS